MRIILLILICGLILTGVSFADEVPIETMPFWSTSELSIFSTGMIWRDCNNDGIIDVFFSNGNDMAQAANTIYLFTSGDFPTSASWSSSNCEFSGHCAVGDIDDDGFPDFIVSNYLGSGWNVPNRSDLYLNSGPLPGVDPAWYTPDSIYSFSCAFGDVDNDGDLDIAFATGEGYHNQRQHDLVYLNDNGVFSDTPVWQSAATTEALDVQWGDVDNDGDLDVAFCFEHDPTVLYYNINGVLETTPSWTAADNNSGNTLVLGDVNGDGWLDLIVAYNYQKADGYYEVYYNDGAGNLNPVHGWESQNNGYGSALALYDYDNDGDDDLATGRWFHELMIYENLGDSFTSAEVWTSDIEMVAEEVAWVDLGGEGVEALADTFPAQANRKLFYTTRHPLYAVDSVVVDGSPLSYEGYCYDLVSGWISLAEAPTVNAAVYYRFSYYNDLTVANWDTVSMAFANTTQSHVNFTADTTFGPVPLAVQFSDHSAEATGWTWDFGDTDSSDQQHPLHVYEEPGYYTVSLTITTPYNEYSRGIEGMISVYDDTLIVDNVQSHPGASVRIDVDTHNYLPLEQLIIPFTWAGPLEMEYDSFSTAGLRTEYFEFQSQVNLDPFNSRGTVKLKSSDDNSLPLLAPGTDAVLSLFFTIPPEAPYDINPVEIAGYSVWDILFTASAGSYKPTTVAGGVDLISGCCTGSSVGNMDCIAGVVDMGDLTVLIDHLFISLDPLCCVEEGDVDLSGQPNPVPGDVDMGDLTVLIDHLFISLSPLPACP